MMEDFKTSKWLEELQHKSWEPEILLSGIVLYGMFKAPPLLDEFLIFFKANILGTFSDIDNLVALLKVAIYWLITGLFLHLISRGIWVGMVGLSYVFPNGINTENLKLNERFKIRVEKLASSQKIIIQLEKLCSSLFSISFMLFMCIIGGYLFVFILVGVPFTIFFFYVESRFSGPYFDAFQIYAITVIVLGIVGLIDFLTLGYIKRFKWAGRIYWPLYYMISTLTLSRYYRHIYYNIISNYSKWKISLFLLLFTVSSIYSIGVNASSGYPGDGFSRIEFWSNGFGMGSFNGYYDDQNEDKYSVQAHIQSDIISGNTIRLFVVADVNKEDSIRKYINYDSLKLSYPDTASGWIQLYSISKFYQIAIDEEILEDQEWKFHYKSNTKQKGYLTYVDITKLEIGLHHLEVKGPGGMYRNSFAIIPFYRELSFEAYKAKDKPKEISDDFLMIKPIISK